MWKKLNNLLNQDSTYQKLLNISYYVTVVAMVICMACMFFEVPFDPLGYFIVGGYMVFIGVVVILLAIMDYHHYKKNSHGKIK